MEETRKIIHIDMDAFFASVEQRDDPSLIGSPVIVGGQPDSRGVVAACSYEARQFGIHSAMPCSKAAKLCPNAIFLPPRFEAYREASQDIHTVFKSYTELIEPLSLDEAYLDVSSPDCYQAKHKGSATLLAQSIKDDIQTKVNLTASAGVSYNKFLAKIASDMDKPNGLYVIRPSQAEAFVEGLEIRKFFGVGKVTEAKMHGLNIFTGLDLKNKDIAFLTQHFGNSGQRYYDIARAICDRPVKNQRKRKSIGKETTFSGDVVDKREIWHTLERLSERVTEVLANKDIFAKTLTLKVKYKNFKQVTRSKTVTSKLSQKQQILDLLPELLRKTDVGNIPIRLIGVSVSSLSSASEQVNDSNEKQLALFNKEPK